MGNRAVVVFGTEPDAVGVYLHWNGGAESVYTFLEALKLAGVRNPSSDYCPARFCQMVGNFFGDTLSLGVWGVGEDAANGYVKAASTAGDNGVYVVKANWSVERYTVTGNWDNPKSKKLSARAVADERKMAAAHKYNADDELLEAVKRANPALFPVDAPQAVAA
jgi:glycosidase